MKFQDLTGQKFNRLTVIERAESPNNNVYWRCRCDCGNECIVAGYRLKSFETLSCGCYNREIVTKHGMTNTAIHQTWADIKQRCYNQKHKLYPPIWRARYKNARRVDS